MQLFALFTRITTVLGMLLFMALPLLPVRSAEAHGPGTEISLDNLGDLSAIECVAKTPNEWHFLISGLASASLAPTHIHIS